MNDIPKDFQDEVDSMAFIGRDQNINLIRELKNERAQIEDEIRRFGKEGEEIEWDNGHLINQKATSEQD